MVETFRDLAPWYEAEARITLARALLQLDDAAHARAHLADAGAYMSRVEDAPVLTRWLEDALELTDQVAAAPWPLTAAELRVLHLLPTHLSYSEIADRLSVSTNTAEDACEGDLSQARRLLIDSPRRSRPRRLPVSSVAAGTPGLTAVSLCYAGPPRQGRWLCRTEAVRSWTM